MEQHLLAFQALADPIRLAIFECVKCCGGASRYDLDSGECDAGAVGSIAACDVRCHVPCSPSSLSRHIAVLREAGLVTSERIGRKLFIQVVPEKVRELSTYFNSEACGCSKLFLTEIKQEVQA